jgi:predicted transcriptional regulator YheO
MNRQENTNAEIVKEIHRLAEHVNEAVHGLAEHMDERFKRVEAVMVTKDYLDEKLADLRGDLVVLMRKEDRKVEQIIQKLKEKRIFSDRDAQEILAMEPFPKSV